jgi:hypothetical protein
MILVSGRGFLEHAPFLSIEQGALPEIVHVVGDVIHEMLP